MQEIQTPYFSDKVDLMMHAYQQVEAIINKYKEDINSCKEDILEAMAKNSEKMSGQSVKLIEKFDKMENSISGLTESINKINIDVTKTLSHMQRYEKMINTFKLIGKAIGIILAVLMAAAQFGWIELTVFGLGKK